MILNTSLTCLSRKEKLYSETYHKPVRGESETTYMASHSSLQITFSHISPTRTETQFLHLHTLSVSVNETFGGRDKFQLLIDREKTAKLTPTSFAVSPSRGIYSHKVLENLLT